MLVELKESRVFVDNQPYAENIKLNMDHKQKLARLKLTYLFSPNREADGEPMDIALAFKLPTLSISSMAMVFEGQELIRDIYFVFNLSFSIIKRKFYVDGTFGGNVIKSTISHPIEVLTIIRSMIHNRISK